MTNLYTQICRKHIQHMFQVWTRLYPDTVAITHNGDFMTLIRRRDTPQDCTVEQIYTNAEQSAIVRAYYSSHLATTDIDSRVTYYPCYSIDKCVFIALVNGEEEHFTANEFARIEQVDRPFCEIPHKSTCYVVALKREQPLSVHTLPQAWQDVATQAIETPKATQTPKPKQTTQRKRTNTTPPVGTTWRTPKNERDGGR